MAKTIIEWLETITNEQIRNKAIINAENNNNISDINNLADAILHAFIWDNTPEGSIFWQIFYDNIRYKYEMDIK